MEKNKKLFCRFTFHRYRNVAKIQLGLNVCIYSACLKRRQEKEKANFGYGLDTTSVPKLFYVKWPHSAYSGIYTHDMGNLWPIPKTYLGILQNFYRKKICGCFRSSYNCYKHMPFDSKISVLKSKIYPKQRHRRQWKFHCKALVGTEVCRDNTAFTVNFSRGHSKKAGQGTQGNNQCTALSSIC